MIKNFFFPFLFIFLFAITVRFYFSDENIIETNKSRVFFSTTQDIDLKDIPLLPSDTKNECAEH